MNKFEILKTTTKGIKKNIRETYKTFADCIDKEPNRRSVLLNGCRRSDVISSTPVADSKSKRFS